MPEILSKIPIGFNLEGYDFVQTSTTETASTPFGGVDANWTNSSLVNNRWVADETLKQVQVQTTCFQSAPLIYAADGKRYYGEVQDSADNKSEFDYSNSGTTAFAGTGAGSIGATLFAHDINDCYDGKLSKKLQVWADNISRAESGRKDFYCGIGIATATVADYLNHFYNLNIPIEKGHELASTRVLCAEVLFNTTGTQGKAYRFRVVDCANRDPKSRAGTAGTDNRGMHYYYDVLDVMIALLLLNDMSELCSFSSSQLRLTVNQSEDLKFPWASAGYNYKKAQIPGYGPKGIAELGLTFESKAGATIKGDHGLWKTQGKTPDGIHAIARARFFVDPENADRAKKAIPNLPDEFFKTNYSDRGIAIFNTATPQSFSSINQLIATKASEIMEYAHYLRAIGRPMKWGNGSLTKQTQPAHTIQLDKQTYHIPQWQCGGTCDCDSFVNWVLLECEITNDSNIHNSNDKIKWSGGAKDWSAAMLNGRINAGYKAITIPDISQAEAGDILIYDYGNGKGHAAIFDSFSGGSITGYGMGTDDKAGGKSTIPASEPSTKSLKEIIRIGKATA